jgi:hypothetical protein
LARCRAIERRSAGGSEVTDAPRANAGRRDTRLLNQLGPQAIIYSGQQQHARAASALHDFVLRAEFGQQLF